MASRARAQVDDIDSSLGQGISAIYRLGIRLQQTKRHNGVYEYDIDFLSGNLGTKSHGDLVHGREANFLNLLGQLLFGTMDSENGIASMRTQTD